MSKAVGDFLMVPYSKMKLGILWSRNLLKDEDNLLINQRAVCLNTGTENMIKNKSILVGEFFNIY